MREAGRQTQRIAINFFEGINSTVQRNLAKITELEHCENCRSLTVGVIEKREGQTNIGTDSSGNDFYSNGNYGVTKFENGNPESMGFFRVSEAGLAILSISIHDHVTIWDHYLDPLAPANTILLKVLDYVSPEEATLRTSRTGYDTVSLVPYFIDPTYVQIYSLDQGEIWNPLTDIDASFYAGQCDFANVDGNMVVVNKAAGNRMINEDGKTITTDIEAGSLYNSPRAARAAFYKNRIYLADIISKGVEYKTTVVRSSLPTGIVALVNEDVTSGTTIKVTDARYIYSTGSSTTNWEGPQATMKITPGAAYGAYSDFTNPNNIETLNGAYATVTTLTSSDYKNHTYKADYDSMVIPSDAYIKGISMDVYGKVSEGSGASIYAYIFNTTKGSWYPLSTTDSFSSADGKVHFTMDQNLVDRFTQTDLANTGGIIRIQTDASPDLEWMFDYFEITVTYAPRIVGNAIPTGMTQYEVYRGGEKIGSTLTFTSVNETSVVSSSPVTLLASDEIWVAGTYDGEKQYRWPNNSTSIGRDVKQYDSFKLAGGDEDAITLFETVGNILMVANHNTIVSWNDYNLENFDLGVGCSSKNGYAKLLGALYFIHYSGVYMTTGSTPTLISRKIEKYIKGATKSGLENAAAGYKGLSVFFAIGDVTLYNYDGSIRQILKDTCLEYHIANQDWYVHTNVKAEEFDTFIDSTGTQRLLMSDKNPGDHVREFLTGATDEGDAIFFRADTKVIQPMANFEIFSNLLSVVTQTERGSSLKCFVCLDEGPFYALEGTISKGVSILRVNAYGIQSSNISQPPMARTIRLSYRDSSEHRCRIIQSAILFFPTTADITE